MGLRHLINFPKVTPYQDDRDDVSNHPHCFCFLFWASARVVYDLRSLLQPLLICDIQIFRSVHFC